MVLVTQEQSETETPYLAPIEIDEQRGIIEKDKPETEKPTLRSNVIAVAGIFVFLFGYFTTMLSAIDLFDPDAEMLTSLLGLPQHAFVGWATFGAAALVVIAGAIMVCSRPVPPAIAVVYFLCPILALTQAFGIPLRLAKKWAQPVAIGYFAIGICFVGVGLSKMISLYVVRDNVESFVGVLYAMLLVVGATCAVGATLKLIFSEQANQSFS